MMIKFVAIAGVADLNLWQLTAYKLYGDLKVAYSSGSTPNFNTTRPFQQRKQRMYNAPSNTATD